METDDWNKLATHSFITARQMVIVCLVLEVIVGGLFIIIADKFDVAMGNFLWWVLQFFGLVVATNLGAVILAIMAQKTANEIGDMYREVFTADFYKTVDSMTTFRSFLIEEAEQDGKSLNNEMRELAQKMYRVMRAELDVKAESVEPIKPLGEYADDAELFG
jgi:hypothetical protein